MALSPANSSDILRTISVRSSTKDSLVIAWEIIEGFASFIHGYLIRYQAIGSAIVQESPLLPSSRSNFDITQLHENTLYDVCLVVYTNASTAHVAHEACLKAATSAHTLSVALGSTFGAFLALGVVVLFVLLAKWQHFRRSRKLFQQQILSADSTESIDDFCIIQENGEIELNCIDMRNCEPEVVGCQRKTGSSPTSDLSADVILRDASVCAFDSGVGLSGPDSGRVLIGLDGYSCANSFILTSPSRDGKPGVSYSLLVPLSASGVLPFLVQQDLDQYQGHGRGQVRGHEVPAFRHSGPKMKRQHPVVRLKLRKHSTVDYSSGEEPWRSAHAHAQPPEADDAVPEQSRDETTATTTMTSPAVNVPLNEPNSDHNATGSGTAHVTSGSPNVLNILTTGCDALPRSISNTW